MEIPSTCTSMVVKTCKMKQKKAVPCLHPCLMDAPLLLLGRCVLPGKNSRSAASTAGGFISREQEQNSASERSSALSEQPASPQQAHNQLDSL